MTSLVLVIAAGIACGVAFGLQGPLSNVIRAHLGPLESAFVLHFTGALVALLPLLILGGGKLGAMHTLPWYTYAVGLLGVCAIVALVFMIPRIGIASTMTIVVAAQLVTAALLDHFGAFGVEVRLLSWDRVFGLAIVFCGVWLTVRH